MSYSQRVGKLIKGGEDSLCLLVLSADKFCKQFGPSLGQTKCRA